ncbi:FGGY-family carbohydrate kinase [Simiduia agarivorans]|uniref:L-fuculokinase n=1 Tax=Simiduia agarivorans (strain DSM 21679 / JCM 13881 / BCRC 17597 / SA1) TaxID=1117647 RepID=K4KN48_SIMAS|nr:FGGY family carbohydrate kinase [Simiduia agarivorans]AFV00457.1 L-fuculokinase [Simiduia agarivorans SA1 = DSM 21679]
MANTLVFDIGKTHIKLCVLDPNLQPLASREQANRVSTGMPYPHADVDTIWQWLCREMQTLTEQYPIARLNITTHGATAALLDSKTGALALPVLDYEFDGLYQDKAVAAEYEAIRDPFLLTQSPRLPFGLNLGRQLHWLKQHFPAEFDQADTLLCYPQYWLWRMTGQRCNEVTSLGCHTDLWQPLRNDYAPLVDQLELREKLPPLRDARDWFLPSQDFCAATGLDPQCRIHTGVHDSNASYWRHRVHAGDAPFTVISTGTWSILMSAGVRVGQLLESYDMLANVDVTGRPVACARFMGGREYEAICRLTNAPLAQNASADAIDQRVSHLLEAQVLALPSFAKAGGPFASKAGSIQGHVPDGSGNCLASLYCALMLDYLLDHLHAQGDIIMEGAFLKNRLLCTLLAQLRPEQTLLLSSDDTGTVSGCALLCEPEISGRPSLTRCTPSEFAQLEAYRDHWRFMVNNLQTMQGTTP